MLTWIKKTLGLRFLTSALKSAGDGEYGPKVKASYWFVHDHAAIVGVVLFIADYALSKALPSFGLCGSSFDCATYDSWVVKVSEVLVSAGLATQAVSTEAPDRRQSLVGPPPTGERRA